MIKVPEQTAKDIEALQRELQRTQKDCAERMQLVRNALEVPESYRLSNVDGGLAFVPPSEGVE